ncbi:unnamed protein product [Angiostrongylus costaricensis]|uniref:DNA-directed RNA polymerase III subunit n=1 Tax=Angiostrongylus costaricensis TaxID=334426 RepID=A0A0R3PU39_ANGCS|nr:unnamed protein product [Angiostrongylus costaricensis]
MENERQLTNDFSRLPMELCWRHERTECSMLKKRKVNCDTTEIIEQKLMKLEQAEKRDDITDEDEDGSEDSEEAPGSNLMSDEDFAEEDNDYCDTYFDNGEGYGDVGSDDNLGGEDY